MVEEWFDAYADDVYSFLAYMVNDAELAKDLTQETFIHAIKGVRRFRGDASPKTWLLVIARNVAINHKRKWRREVIVDDSFLAAFESQIESPEDAAERSDTRRRLLDALYSMKFEYRAVIVCREIMGMSSEETAQVLGWTPNRVRVTLHRALKRAKRQLIEGGWAHELARY